jgi:hypothetical protein
MELFARILAALGFGAKTLDKAIALMTKLDSYLAQVEAIEKAKSDAAAAAIDKATADKIAAEQNANRAARIRDRAKEFVA